MLDAILLFSYPLSAVAPVDCVITGAPSDSKLCGALKSKDGWARVLLVQVCHSCFSSSSAHLEAASITSYSNLSEGNDASKLVGKALVDTKVSPSLPSSLTSISMQSLTSPVIRYQVLLSNEVACAMIMDK